MNPPSLRYNFCTLSYSLAFASANDWRDQVDWMAMHGINLPLASIGTEHVEALTYKVRRFYPVNCH